MSSEVAIIGTSVKGFLKKKQDHKMRKRRMDSYASNAVSILAEIAADKSEPSKDRVTAAKSILDYQMALYKDDNNEEVRRLELQLKYADELEKHLTAIGGSVEDDEEELSAIDFNTVIPIE